MVWSKDRRSYNLYVNHRLSELDYDNLLKQQDYRCAICHTPVDHDHKCCPKTFSCGKCVRGLLCKACNSGLGHFKDNLGIVMSAVRYLSEQTYFELEDSF